MRAAIRTAWILASLAALVALAIFVADLGLHRPLEHFRLEYLGGGSCKLRGQGGFEALLLAGLIAFPVAIIAAGLFVISLVSSPRSVARWLGLAASAVILATLVHLDFVGPLLGICPPAGPAPRTSRPHSRATHARTGQSWVIGRLPRQTLSTMANARGSKARSCSRSYG